MIKAYKNLKGEFMPDGSFMIKDLQTAETTDYPAPTNVEITHMTVWNDKFQASYKLENGEWVEINS